MITNRKAQFLKAVHILAPGNQFIHRVALSVPEEQLPVAPGGAALELVATLANMLSPAMCPRRKAPRLTRSQGAASGGDWELSLTE
jgi:hypothetical protein